VIGTRRHWNVILIVRWSWLTLGGLDLYTIIFITYNMAPSRQLAAIMFTDIVGYTALMGKDSNKAMGLDQSEVPDLNIRDEEFCIVNGTKVHKSFNCDIH